MEVSQYPTQMDKRHFLFYLNNYTQWLTRLGYAEDTVSQNSRMLGDFFDWLESNQATQLEQIEQKHIEQFKTYLETRKNKNLGYTALSISYISSYINAIRLFNQYLQLIEEPPFMTGRIEVGKWITPETIVLTREEIKKMYDETDNSLLGYRNRAILSLYYGCGLRASEGLNLETKDIYYGKGLLYVRPGKTKKSRYVPMSEKVSNDLKEYEAYSRKQLLNCDSEQLILNYRGKPYKTPSSIGLVIKKIADQAGIIKRVYPHLLRHSIATHLLESGMDLEQIGQFLGHRSLEATELYTKIIENGKQL